MKKPLDIRKILAALNIKVTAAKLAQILKR
ncbi:hypothetical protein GGC63_003355 [Paenibacillus sp. OAS669]|nr:hypothetical protein [Paenibacillus sp. OAS669]